MASSQLPIRARYGCSTDVNVCRTALKAVNLYRNRGGIGRLSRPILPP
jgi:hypothetical protein